jgi:hypothetical protein
LSAFAGRLLLARANIVVANGFVVFGLFFPFQSTADFFG